MSITIGLDFGTHQTKICIEDASNPLQKLYEFFEFNNPNGEKTVLLPSIVQINNDETLSYGFADKKNCKTITADNITKPKLKELVEPILELPKKLTKQKYPVKPIIQKEKLSWKDQLKLLKKGKSKKENDNPDLINWRVKCIEIDRINENHLTQWTEVCEKKKKAFKILHEEWKVNCEINKKQFKKDLKDWEGKKEDKLRFRYFKLATFSNSVKWKHNIEPEIISTWYLTYILFSLQVKFGEDFFIQMGIPSGIKRKFREIQEDRAYAILISAYKLVEFFESKKSFLSAKYTDLLELTEINYSYSEDELFEYGLNVIPEAYAGLTSITQRKGIEKGMNLLVDIGGGTTDIAFFTIYNDQPDIHAVISFPKGLNFIFENHEESSNELNTSEIQSLFFEAEGDNLIFGKSIKIYHTHLSIEVKEMLSRIISSFNYRSKIHKLSIKKLYTALENRPIVFCGGGAMYKSMLTEASYFTDIKIIDNNLLKIPTITNKNLSDKLFTILATSYGLSIPLENEIELTPLEDIFSHIVPSFEKQNNSYNYEHGLSDL